MGKKKQAKSKAAASKSAFASLEEMTVELPVLMTNTQAANYLGLSPRTLEAWRVDGVGPEYIKLGGKHVRYTQQGLLAYLEGRTTRAAAS